MFRRFAIVAAVALALAVITQANSASAQDRAFGQSWGHDYTTQDYNRFYHYPYVYYPQNYWGNEYYRSADNMYHRYPAEMRIPVYNRAWQNYYPSARRYHWGHQFLLDVF
jgi:hypothetical protein